MNITYKLLYNDAVAMTGGQRVGERPEGHSVLQIAQSMKAEGAQRITVVTDEPEKYEGAGLVDGVAVFGLPGNPVSSLVSFELLARPGLLRSSGRREVQRRRARGKGGAVDGGGRRY